MVEVKVTVAAIAAALTSVALALVRHLALDEAAVQTLVMTLITFVSAYMAPHTPRPGA